MRLETLAVHAGRRVDPTTGAVTPAIHPSTTFEREPDGSYPRGFLYARNAKGSLYSAASSRPSRM